MNNEESKQKLQELHDRILANVSSMADQLVDADSADFETLLSLARSTGKPELMEKAMQRAEAMEDNGEKMDSLLDLLDVVDAQMDLSNGTVASAEEAPQDQPQEGEHQDQGENNDY